RVGEVRLRPARGARPRDAPGGGRPRAVPGGLRARPGLRRVRATAPAPQHGHLPGLRTRGSVPPAPGGAAARPPRAARPVGPPEELAAAARPRAPLPPRGGPGLPLRSVAAGPVRPLLRGLLRRRPRRPG